jgi:membrane protease YdiL (CAAX protease family)
VDCIVNDPTINIPAAPRFMLVVASALSEEMLFRAVLVTLLSRGLSAGLIIGGLEDVAPWGASGTGAAMAAVLFAALIALVPISKVSGPDFPCAQQGERP